MSEFKSALRFSDSGGYPFTLISPLSYRSALLGPTHVPKGFKTDLASIPWFAQPLFHFLRVGRYDRAAVVHDWLYATQYQRKAVCDRVLLEAMLADGVGFWPAHLIYWGVRLGGWWAWHSDHKHIQKFRHYR